MFATVGTGGTPLRDINSADAEAGYFASQQGQEHRRLRTDSWISKSPIRISAPPSLGLPAAPSVIALRFRRARGTKRLSLLEPANFSLTWMWRSMQAVPRTWTGWWSTTGGTLAMERRETASPQRTRTRAGSFPVTLTVVDDDGVASSTTRVVSVTDAPTSLAADSFGRTLTSGWGIADEGGAWSTSGAAGAVSVNGAAGILRPMTAGSSASANLTNVQVTGSDLRATVSLDKTASGGDLSKRHRPTRQRKQRLQIQAAIHLQR